MVVTRSPKPSPFASPPRPRWPSASGSRTGALASGSPATGGPPPALAPAYPVCGTSPSASHSANPASRSSSDPALALRKPYRRPQNTACTSSSWAQRVTRSRSSPATRVAPHDRAGTRPCSPVTGAGRLVRRDQPGDRLLLADGERDLGAGQDRRRLSEDPYEPVVLDQRKVLQQPGRRGRRGAWRRRACSSVNSAALRRTTPRWKSRKSLQHLAFATRHGTHRGQDVGIRHAPTLTGEATGAKSAGPDRSEPGGPPAARAPTPPPAGTAPRRAAGPRQSAACRCRPRARPSLRAGAVAPAAPARRATSTSAAPRPPAPP
ncbi:hypothetical protein EES44_14695 [Streptomyces sp. ADI96-15]|nr:hypothetical protein EES44_14695 [Streptomyces sp. ADI96-15]